MLNKIWFGLLLIGLVYGFARPLVVGPAIPQAAAPAAPSTQAGETPAPQKTSATATQGEAPAPRGSGAAAKAPPTSASGMPAALTDAGKKLTTAAIDAAKTSVEICIMLIGVMALWLGLMKIAEEAGLVDLIARGLRPLLARLFPDVPEGHPAGGAIIMNFAANMLGLDNAATPLGLKAMKELQTLNPYGETVSNSMAMFLAINASSITIIPFTVIGYRAAAGSADPAAPMVAMMLATACAVTTSIVACRLLQPLYPLGDPPAGPIASEGQTQEGRS